jgi:predicted DsbA family dithiol-disulfide isomerase
MSNEIHINYYSDILCIWAYVSQIRIAELEIEFSEKVDVNYMYFSIFGDAQYKLKSRWEKTGGLKAYNQHVRSIASDFSHIEVHPEIWLKNSPSSSLPAHLYLAATHWLENNQALEPRSAHELRIRFQSAFFQSAQDLSKRGTLDEIVETSGMPLTEIRKCIDDGHAFSQLAHDQHHANEHSIKSSPTMVFNHDRQRLAGNVGYKIIAANVRELIERPSNGLSWC